MKYGLVLGIFLLGGLFAAPIAFKAAGHDTTREPWYRASNAPTGMAPSPAEERRAVIQVYAAPTFGWRGIFAVHTWIIVKPTAADAYRRYDVVGWGGGSSKVRLNYAAPDAMWYGATPELLVDRRGEGVDALIAKVEKAVADYPFADRYRSFPGPNSNTFTAHIGRAVPELGLDLPANAIGKDYRSWTAPLAVAPSGRGMQVSLLGLAGIIVSPVEGLELNLLGLSVGIDASPLGLRLPSIGRLP